MLSVVMLSVVMLNVIMLSFMAPALIKFLIDKKLRQDFVLLA